MKYRAIEIVFRHKFLIVFPAILVVCITAALALRPRGVQWQSFAAVWVDSSKVVAPDGTQSTATTQAQLLNDFIHTRTFATSVLKQTPLAPLLDKPSQSGTLVSQFQQWTHTIASGYFVTIVATTPDPDLSYQLAQGVVTTFQNILQGQADNQVQATLNAYTSTLKDAQSALTKSQSDLAKYLTAHPELTQANGGVRASDVDPTYAYLANEVSNDQDNYNAIQHSIASLQQNAATGQQQLPFTFTLVDQPQRPDSPVRSSRLNMIKLPAIGMVVGLLLSASLAGLLILSNQTLLGAPNLQETLGVPVLGEIRPIRGGGLPWERKSSNAGRSILPWRRKHADRVRLALTALARLKPSAAARG